MTKFYLANIFTFLFILSQATLRAQDFCENELDAEIKTLLTSEADLFGEALYISQLRLARKLSEDHYQRIVLEKEIQEQVNSMDPLAIEKIEKASLRSYRGFGEAKVSLAAKELVNDPDAYNKALGPAIAARVFNSLDVECSNGAACLGEVDEAFAWLATEIGIDPTLAKNLNPAETSEFYLKGNEGKEARAEIKLRLSKLFQEKLLEFKANEKVCGSVSSGQSCRKARETSNLETQAHGMLSLVAPQEEFQVSPKEKHSQAIKKIRGHLGWKKTLEEPSRSPANNIEPKKNYVCGGEEFYPSVENKDIYGFLNPKGGVKNVMSAFDIYKKKGLSGLRSFSKSNSAFGGRGGGKFSGAKFLNKLTIPGPMFRCTPDSPIALPKIGYLNADKNVCCDEKVQTRKMQYVFFNWGGGLTCRVFFGLPYLAEVGAKIGAGVNLVISGGQEPSRCEDKTCFAASPKINVSAGLYAEALAGAGSLDGTISWLPYASVQQCLMANGDTPPANFKYQVGRVLFIGTARVGWAFKYSTVKTIYENDDTKTSIFPIF